MKKTISILITIALLFSITSCTKEPESYVADDFSYLMFDGVKYERVEMPFNVNCADLILNPSWDVSKISFQNINMIQLYLYHYDAAKRDPLVWWSDNYYQLYEATLGNGKTVKVVYNDLGYVYALPEEKDELEQRFQNAEYLFENGYILVEWGVNESFSFKISSDLAKAIVEKYESYIEIMTPYATQNNRYQLYINKEDEAFDGYISEYAFVYLFDSNGDFKKQLFEIVVCSKGVFLYDDTGMWIYEEKYLPDGKSFTPISEIEYLFLPDEFNEELAPVIEEIMRIREERLASQ